ncbi:MAG: hypothetical protein QCI82_10205 [Candidatus Thermoplasmatota archaeon]|nr:hypothetical protein [Candidatus Thermoplasmatota archaeon]
MVTKKQRNGLAVLILGIVIGPLIFGAGMFLVFSRDPAKNNVAALGQSGSVDLKEGKYEIWGNCYGVKITDPSGYDVSINSPSVSTTINGIDCYGSFEIQFSGNYDIDYSGFDTLYITKPTHIGVFMTMPFIGCCSGALIALVGLILTIVAFSRKNREIASGYDVGGNIAQTGNAPFKRNCRNCGCEIDDSHSICPGCYCNLM